MYLSDPASSLSARQSAPPAPPSPYRMLQEQSELSSIAALMPMIGLHAAAWLGSLHSSSDCSLAGKTAGTAKEGLYLISIQQESFVTRHLLQAAPPGPHRRAAAQEANRDMGDASLRWLCGRGYMFAGRARSGPYMKASD